ncbi:MAG: iron-containing alcohol dehydrogenase [Lachnospiraceae bacterium]|nr:iron-containing alcohol dehydrogenase [Lachnospiraceae bacterium]
MNIINQIYCRAYQTGFRIAIPFLPYRNPEILHALDDIPDLLKERSVNRVLLVTDRSIRTIGLTKHLEEILTEEGFFLTVYDGVAANPTVQQVEEARGLYIEHDCQALIGFGGGSSMDLAKAVGVLIARPDKTLAQLKGVLKVHAKTPLTIAVPTTAGTGSETTVAAVIVDDETRHKYAIMDFPLIPEYAVLDPVVTRTLPAGITAGTGIDALTHAIEAYIGRSTTKQTRRESLRAVRLIFHNLEKVYQNGNDLKARRNMLRASYLAGSAFTVSYVGYVHAVAHALGGQYNLPHGQTCATVLPYVLEAYGAAIYPQLKALAVAAGLCDLETDEAQAAQLFLHALRDLNRKVGIPEKIPGIRREDIPMLAKTAAKEANPSYPVPVLMDARELKRFFYEVME